MVATRSLAADLLRSKLMRAVLIGLGVLVLIVIASAVYLSSTRASHSQPINVDVYPGAKLLEKQVNAQSDRRVYSTTDSVDQVLVYYAERLNKDDENGCKKIYTDSTPSEQPGHFIGRCIVDTSWMDVSQSVAIRVSYTAASGTVIEVERAWGG